MLPHCWCIVLVVLEPWHNSGLKDVENVGNLRRTFEHCVWVCLEKRTFQLHVSADHEKKYSLQTVKVKAPSLCWHSSSSLLSLLAQVSGSERHPVGFPERSPAITYPHPLSPPSSVWQHFSFIKPCFCLAHWGPFLSTSDLCLDFGYEHNSLYWLWSSRVARRAYL